MPPSDTGAAPAAEVAAAPVAAAPAVSAPVAGVVETTGDGTAVPSPSPAPSAVEQTIIDKPAEAAPAEAEKAPEPAAPVDPASYEVTLPEGMTREDPLVAAFLEGAAGASLDGKAVQAVLDKTAPLVAAALAAPHKAWEQLNSDWQAAIKADPDVGGAKLPAAVESVTNLLDRHGSAELKEALKVTGAVNNPAVFKFLHKMAAAYAESGSVAAGASAPVPNTPSAAALMYPSARPNGAARA